MENSDTFTGSLLRSQLVGLEKRTEVLEASTLALAARLAVLEGAPVTESAPVFFAPEPECEPISVHVSAATEVYEPRICEPEPICQPISVHPLQQEAEPDEKTPETPTQQSIESRIGLYWLSKLGIGFLVIGVALLIMYSFGNFGPVAKVATGFIISAALMALGEYMERDNNMPWYARLIEGGAWALGYFTTYAMYHVESVRIVNSPIIDSLLLLVVSGLAVYHATCKRSEIMAIFAVSLGFITLGLSQATLFTGLASALLVAVSVFLSCKQKWSQLYLYSVFASYGALLYCGSLEPLAGVSATQNFLTMSLLLVPSLLGFSLAPLFLEAPEGLARQSVSISVVANAVAFCALFFAHAYRELGSDASIYNLIVGAWFFLVAYLYDRRELKFLSSLNSFSALTLSTFFFCGASLGNKTWPWLALEAAMVVWVGLRHELKTFRWFGNILGGLILVGNLTMVLSTDVINVLGFTVPFFAVSAIAAIAALLFAAFAQKRAAFATSGTDSARKVNFYTFWNEALVLAWLLPIPVMSVEYQLIGHMAEPAQTPFLIAAWSLLGAAVLTMAIALRNRYMAIVTIAISASLALPITFNGHFSWLVSGLGCAALFAAAFLLRRSKECFGPYFFQAQYLVAYAIVALLPLSADLRVEQMIAFWSVQGFVNLLLGFKIRDGFVRLLTAVIWPVAAVTALKSSIDWPLAWPILLALWSGWALYRLGINRVVMIKTLADSGIADGEHDVRHLFSVLATIVLCACINAQLQGGVQVFVWGVQGLVLLAAGLFFRDNVLRFCAIGAFAWLTTRLFPGSCEAEVILPAVACMFGAWEMYRLPARLGKEILDPGEIEYRHFYSVIASGLLAAFFAHRVIGEWVSCGWAAEAIVLLLVGLLRRDCVLRMTSLTVILTLVLRLFLAPLQIGLVIPAVVALYAGWALYRSGEHFHLPAWEKDFRHIYSIIACLLLAIGLAAEMHNTWVSCTWAVQGIATLLVGFVTREKTMRVSGLCLFGALTFRLFFIDLAGAPTVYRIFAFIVTGCILLLSAYGYNWFARRFGEEDGLTIAPADGLS